MRTGSGKTISRSRARIRRTFFRRKKLSAWESRPPPERFIFAGKLIVYSEPWLFASAHTDVDRLQKRWILGALGLALVIHVIAAWALDWYKDSGDGNPERSFGRDRAFHGQADRDQSELPQARSRMTRSPSFPAPSRPATRPNSISTRIRLRGRCKPRSQRWRPPNVPEPNKVIAATDLSQGLPMVRERLGENHGGHYKDRSGHERRGRSPQTSLRRT